MPFPRSLAAYADCEAHFERALASANGIAVTLDSEKQMHAFRIKMNTYREKLRKQSRAVHQPEDPRYGVSPYDQFKLTIDPENPCRVIIKAHVIDVVKVEEL